MLKKIFYTFLFLCLITPVFPQQKTPLTCKEIMTKTIKSIKEVKGLKYHLKITERGKKGFNYYESAVKFNRNPRLIYLYIKGIEVLWLQGKNKGRALVKPNSFPYINLNLDPMGDLMRQDQHHTLNEMGYDYFGNIIEYSMYKLGDKFDDYFSLEGEERINNRPCYKIMINNKDFGYTDYTVQENESITSIARKFYVSEYMILEKNPKFKDYFDILKKGQVIKIPTWYCKTVTIYVDQLYFLPISVKVVDDKGVFEEYNYHFLQVNPKFEEGEFTRDYKDYKF
ncbi:MAG: LysM peptidoglycan-binding domain-containing protein [Bacteroidia bacterium]